jgi:hypothetical protein
MSVIPNSIPNKLHHSDAQIAPRIDDLGLTNTYDTLAMRRLKSATSIQPIPAAAAPASK